MGKKPQHGICIDPVKLVAMKDGQVLELPLTELRVLAYLLANKGRTITRKELFTALWEGKAADFTNIVDVYINYVRNKIGKEMITTVRGQGYVFMGQAA